MVLFNHSDKDFEVKKGDRIAQLICEQIFYPVIVEEKSLEETKRGADGFGSTGIQEVVQTNGKASPKKNGKSDVKASPQKNGKHDEKEKEVPEKNGKHDEKEKEGSEKKKAAA